MKGIVAIAKNGVVGAGNTLPWRCPDDLKFFKAQTLGKTIIMGKKTFDGIGKFLPDRKTVVLTRTPEKDYETSNIEILKELDDVYLCGGAEIYKKFSHLCSEFLVTHLDIEPEGDVYFPLEALEWFSTQEVIAEGISNNIAYKIVRYK